MTVRQELNTKPTQEPISLDEAKDHLKVETNEEDDLISVIVEAVRVWVEETTGRALINQTWDYYPEAFEDKMELPKAPVQSISQIDYIDTDGNTQTLSSATYDLDKKGIDSFVRLAYNQVWPSVRNTYNAITIRYVAGYGSNSHDVPKPIIQAMLILISDLYENKESYVEGVMISQVPFSAKALLAPYGLPSFG